MAGLYGNSIFNFSEELSYRFPWKWHYFKFLPTVHKGSNFFITLPIVTVFCSFFFFFFDSRYPNGYELVSHCGFDLHFPDN